MAVNKMRKLREGGTEIPQLFGPTKEVVSEPPSQTLEANQGAPQFQECFMDVLPPLVAHVQPPAAGKPG